MPYVRVSRLLATNLWGADFDFVTRTIKKVVGIASVDLVWEASAGKMRYRKTSRGLRAVAVLSSQGRMLSHD